jgi:hypothetical protein
MDVFDDKNTILMVFQDFGFPPTFVANKNKEKMVWQK